MAVGRIAGSTNKRRSIAVGPTTLSASGYISLDEDDEDDVFVRDDGGPPLSQRELQIDPQLTNPGDIWLANGVVLLPRLTFESGKQLVDKDKALMRERRRTQKAVPKS
jgi:hypothetical protein